MVAGMNYVEHWNSYGTAATSVKWIPTHFQIVTNAETTTNTTTLGTNYQQTYLYNVSNYYTSNSILDDTIGSSYKLLSTETSSTIASLIQLNIDSKIWTEIQGVSKEQYAEILAQQAEAEAKRKRIEEKANRLLRATLTGRQRKTYEKLGFFDVQSKSDPAVVYRIPKSDLILMFKNGKPEKRLCVHPKEYSLPKGDELLGLKMFVEADEAELHHVAITHELRKSRLERLPLFV